MGRSKDGHLLTRPRPRDETATRSCSAPTVPSAVGAVLHWSYAMTNAFRRTFNLMALATGSGREPCQVAVRLAALIRTCGLFSTASLSHVWDYD